MSGACDEQAPTFLEERVGVVAGEVVARLQLVSVGSKRHRLADERAGGVGRAVFSVGPSREQGNIVTVAQRFERCQGQLLIATTLAASFLWHQRDDWLASGD